MLSVQFSFSIQMLSVESLEDVAWNHTACHINKTDPGHRRLKE